MVNRLLVHGVIVYVVDPGKRVVLGNADGCVLVIGKIDARKHVDFLLSGGNVPANDVNERGQFVRNGKVVGVQFHCNLKSRFGQGIVVIIRQAMHRIIERLRVLPAVGGCTFGR